MDKANLPGERVERPYPPYPYDNINRQLSYVNTDRFMKQFIIEI
jgi:hypothetical protein